MCRTQLDALKLLLVIVVLVASATANAGLFGFGGTSWQEEVLLYDGTKIVADRSVSRGGPHEIGQRGSYTKQTLAFTHPATGKRIIWEDKATPDLGTSSFLPMALDIYQGEVYLVANPMGCLAYNKWGRPNPPYVVFKLSDNNWIRVTLDELPTETKAPNLIFSSPDTEVERLGRRFVDAETIKRIVKEYSQPRNRTISREEVEEPEGRCGEMVSDGHGAWIGVGWFKKQKTLEACLNYCEMEKVNGENCPCKTIFRDKQSR